MKDFPTNDTKETKKAQATTTSTSSGAAARRRYDAEKMKTYGARCHIVNDYDIIEFLEKQDNKSEDIKAALRLYIQQQS